MDSSRRRSFNRLQRSSLLSAVTRLTRRRPGVDSRAVFSAVRIAFYVPERSCTTLATATLDGQWTERVSPPAVRRFHEHGRSTGLARWNWKRRRVLGPDPSVCMRECRRRNRQSFQSHSFEQTNRSCHLRSHADIGNQTTSCSHATRRVRGHRLATMNRGTVCRRIAATNPAHRGVVKMSERCRRSRTQLGTRAFSLAHLVTRTHGRS